MVPSLLLMVLWSAPQPVRPIARPPVVIQVVADDVLLIRSRMPIHDITIERLYSRYDYFIDFSPDRTEALVRLRTYVDPLLIQVQTNIPGTAIIVPHSFVQTNPTHHTATSKK